MKILGIFCEFRGFSQSDQKILSSAMSLEINGGYCYFLHPVIKVRRCSISVVWLDLPRQT